jgi:hypothetical protein
MRLLYKFVFATKSSHISRPYKLVQKLETEIEIFPAVRRSRGHPPLPRRPPESGPSTRRRRRRPRRESRRPREAPDRGTKAAGRSPWRSTSRGIELRHARHGEGRPAQPPHAPWNGRLRRRSSPSRVFPGASCRRSPRRRRCGRRSPRQPRVPSRCGAGAPNLLHCRPPPGPCSSSLSFQGPSANLVQMVLHSVVSFCIRCYVLQL